LFCRFLNQLGELHIAFSAESKERERMAQTDKEAVERFDCVGSDGEMASGADGGWVRYEDHRAALDAAEAEKRDAVEVARQTIWDALNGSQQAEQLCDAIDAAIRQETNDAE
jgi:hypothetical protein